MTKAPAELRYLICALMNGTGDPDSLANVNTSELPDGSTAYVISEAAIFTLDKTSTATPVAGLVLAPGSGPGRWFLFATSATRGSPAFVRSTGANSFAAPDGNWGSSTGTLFTTEVLSDWSLTALAGVLTYTGESRDFLATAIASLQVGSVASQRQMYLGIDHNGDLTGAAGTGILGSQSTPPAVASVPYALSTSRRLSLVSGQTVRVKAGATTGSGTLVADSLTLSLLPL